MSKVTNEGFYVVQGWMINKLHLSGLELSVYAIIYGHTQDKKTQFVESMQYLADWTNSTVRGVRKAIDSLIEKGLVQKNVYDINNQRVCTYLTLMKCELSSQGVNLVPEREREEERDNEKDNEGEDENEEKRKKKESNIKKEEINKEEKAEEEATEKETEKVEGKDKEHSATDVARASNKVSLFTSELETTIGIPDSSKIVSSSVGKKKTSPAWWDTLSVEEINSFAEERSKKLGIKPSEVVNAKAFLLYYNMDDKHPWTDAQGNKVKNWKMKIMQVWEGKTWWQNWWESRPECKKEPKPEVKISKSFKEACKRLGIYGWDKHYPRIAEEVHNLRLWYDTHVNDHDFEYKNRYSSTWGGLRFGGRVEFFYQYIDFVTDVIGDKAPEPGHFKVGGKMFQAWCRDRELEVDE